ncbi:SchA/CurD-like domain-containing protein [Asanoa sp. WMMD1127]|uniref:SchA/CurD-like domain-containing protein n=1 Tax=Asanoa sp. WMMD1127 TaxID=3016107 RepID=UPI0024175ABF|nr:SchA/CurD-like domain-containing protein [Asanoa sp. WMMD1127]MDG4820767.1 SchA/CurD-like domain-containing protein [Asanoa sp. WMMD1127]
MPIAAITYDIKAGCEDEIAKIFTGFRRVGNPAVTDAAGREVGKILSTALFIRDATMVRFIEYEGSLADVARFMAGQPGVQEVERKLKPFLASPRHTDTVDGFVATLTGSEMRCLSALSVRD